MIFRKDPAPRRGRAQAGRRGRYSPSTHRSDSQYQGSHHHAGDVSQSVENPAQDAPSSPVIQDQGALPAPPPQDTPSVLTSLGVQPAQPVPSVSLDLGVTPAQQAQDTPPVLPGLGVSSTQPAEDTSSAPPGLGAPSARSAQATPSVPLDLGVSPQPAQDSSPAPPGLGVSPDPLSQDAPSSVPGQDALPVLLGTSEPTRPASETLKDADELRAKAWRVAKKRVKLFLQGHNARALGDTRFVKRLRKKGNALCEEAKELHRRAADMYFRVRNRNAKPGEFDLHFLHVPEARERADRIIEEAMSKGDRKVRFITGKGIHSRSGPKLLPALRDHLARRGLKYEQDPENAGILTVYLQDPET
ncbi:hypothetical protein BC826DRAFT_998225 [Russula brevipes]|nr:hypothetical protein BC826DRAFT_998225 [Russula brevipes]